MSTENERNVVVMDDVDPKVAADRLNRETGSHFEGLEQAVPVFKKVEDYTTFLAEYMYANDDLIVHFFRPKEMELDNDYWLKRFPAVLDAQACYYFDASAPRLIAKFTEEVDSWWFKAQGFGARIAPDDFALKFFEELDRSLDGALGRA